MIDTGTVRLVIFFVMFLVFAGDYAPLISRFFGAELEQRNVTAAKDGAEKMTNALQDNDNNKDSPAARRARMMTTIRTACLPKLICELTSSAHQDQLGEMERSLLNLIRDTSLSSMAEVASRYHFAAHMGQLISGIEGQGCHNFYPTCPLPGVSVLSIMKKIRIR